MLFPYDVIADPVPVADHPSLWWIAALALVVVALVVIGLIIRTRRSH